MGTDIHAFIEVDYAPSGPPFRGAKTVSAFNEGEFRLSQNPQLLDALGDGTKFHSDGNSSRRHSFISPRGLPPNLSFAIYNRYTHIIVKEETDVHYFNQRLSWLSPNLPAVSQSQAQQWVDDGFSSYLGCPWKVHYGAGKVCKERVSHPDWHSPSWLTIREILDSLEYFGIPLAKMRENKREMMFPIVVDVMKQIEAKLGEGRTRLVFWFDN